MTGLPMVCTVSFIFKGPSDHEIGGAFCIVAHDVSVTQSSFGMGQKASQGEEGIDKVWTTFVSCADGWTRASVLQARLIKVVVLARWEMRSRRAENVEHF